MDAFSSRCKDNHFFAETASVKGGKGVKVAFLAHNAAF